MVIMLIRIPFRRSSGCSKYKYEGVTVFCFYTQYLIYQGPAREFGESFVTGHFFLHAAGDQSGEVNVS